MGIHKVNSAAGVVTSYSPEVDKLFIHVGEQFLSAGGAELDALLRHLQSMADILSRRKAG
jgi:hypothetical protein